MFVQVIQGRAKDAEGLLGKLRSWPNEAGQGATGWLGSTAGVSADGEFVAVARFASEEAAQANSDRPEQDAWAKEMAQYLDGEVTFKNCRQADVFLDGGSDDAGFVQIMQGRADREALRSRAAELDETLRRMRPDVIGGVIAWHDDEDGQFTQAIYFRSEAEARQGESQELSEEDAAARDELMASLQDVRFIDLREPLLLSGNS